jgi:hypothetical protein
VLIVRKGGYLKKVVLNVNHAKRVNLVMSRAKCVKIVLLVSFVKVTAKTQTPSAACYANLGVTKIKRDKQVASHAFQGSTKTKKAKRRANCA